MIKKLDTVTYETDEYEKFRLVDWNRKVNQCSVDSLAQSIAIYGYIGSPIIVNENYEIIDGQHRFMACKKINVNVRFQIQKGYGMQQAMTLNKVQSQWTLKQYISAYAINGNDEQKNSYRKLEDLLLDYGQMLDVTVCAVKGYQARGKNNPISSGNLVITDEEYIEARRKLDFIDSLSEYTIWFGDNKRAVLSALIKLKSHNLFDDERMREQFEKYGDRFISTNKDNENIKALDELYNINRKVKEHFVDKYKSLNGD